MVSLRNIRLTGVTEIAVLCCIVLFVVRGSEIALVTEIALCVTEIVLCSPIGCVLHAHNMHEFAVGM